MNTGGTIRSTPSVEPERCTGYDSLIIGPPETPLTQIERQRYYVEKELIVTGYEDDINNVCGGDRLSQALEIVPDAELELGQGRQQLWSPFLPDTTAGLRIRLYRIKSGESVGDLVRQIYEEAIRQHVPVFPDPNFAIGPALTDDISGNPESVEGGPAGNSTAAGKGRFSKQWAFGKRGIRLSTSASSEIEHTVAYRGKGVQVGVFDASPFKDPGGWRIPWAPFADEWPLELCVSHPSPHGASPLFTGLRPFCDHGLFVAGLVHAVAPESNIHLIRVLNDENRGSLTTLNNALKQFIYKIPEAEDEKPTGTVINLSLGVRIPPDLEAAGLPPDLPALQSALFAALGYELPAGWPSPSVLSLDALLLDAYSRGIVVVASAGNESKCPVHADPPLIPAAYPHVLGVAGSNISRGRAFFSNAGDVAAPGGDNRPGCRPWFVSYDKDPACRLVSLSMRTSPASGYAYWAGTSFAAPLVSGLAALLLQKGGSTMLPQDVYARIKERAIVALDGNLGAGIVDVPNTFK